MFGTAHTACENELQKSCIKYLLILFLTSAVIHKNTFAVMKMHKGHQI